MFKPGRFTASFWQIGCREVRIGFGTIFASLKPRWFKAVKMLAKPSSMLGSSLDAKRWSEEKMSSGLYSGSGAKDFQKDDERKGFLKRSWSGLSWKLLSRICLGVRMQHDFLVLVSFYSHLQTNHRSLGCFKMFFHHLKPWFRSSCDFTLRQQKHQSNRSYSSVSWRHWHQTRVKTGAPKQQKPYG